MVLLLNHFESLYLLNRYWKKVSYFFLQITESVSVWTTYNYFTIHTSHCAYSRLTGGCVIKPCLPLPSTDGTRNMGSSTCCQHEVFSLCVSLPPASARPCQAWSSVCCPSHLTTAWVTGTHCNVGTFERLCK